LTNYYETVLIVRPTADEDTVTATVSATKDHITSAGGEILFENVWGKRRLAYPVQEFGEGIYAQLNFTAPSDYPQALERFYRLHDDVIRDLVIRTDGPPPPPEEMPHLAEHAPMEGRLGGRDEGPDEDEDEDED